MARASRARTSRAGGPTSIDGILLLDKPEGVTSAEVVRRIKRKVGGKVGHLGTLDPFATGLLPLCLGEATKVAQFLNTADKEYEGTIALGIATDTGDRTGLPRREMPVPELSEAALRVVAARFSGEQLQTPPMYSAIKRGGVPLYELARKGVEVEREPRPITIARLELTLAAPAQVQFRVACSKGTYVRVLAEDIGRELGTVAHLAELRRTGFGPFRIDRAVAGVDDWDPATASGLLSIREALADLPAIELSERSVTAVRRGQGWVLRDLAIPEKEARTALLLAEGGRPLAVVQRAGPGWRFARVLS